MSAPARDEHGVLTHEIESPYQADKTKIRVLLPEKLESGKRYPVIYLLPVEAGDEHHYGSAMEEIVKQELSRHHAAIFVAPTFAQLPWYADHPSDATTGQESHLLKAVLPLVEKTYPADAKPVGRLLLGFSKSGWGAWSLLLRHPDLFSRAAAWDAPLMMDAPGKYGSGPIFATQENFDRYCVVRLLRQRAELLRGETQSPRLILTGYGNFRDEHQRMHMLLDELKIPHAYRDGPQRKHDWHSGWLAEAVELLLAENAAK